jgi:hypothetical protein
VQIPFSIEEFLGVFRAYNLGVWPAQIGLYGLGLLLVVIALAGSEPARRWGVAGGLAVLWSWMGAVYHLNFFVGINPAARGFAALFLAQAALWITWAWRTPILDFRPLSATGRLVGGGLLAYALFVYPLLNVLFGHGYPEMPTFGLPCPTTIATFGLLSWASPRPPWFVWAIPVAWAFIGTSASFILGIPEDLGLAVTATLAVAVQLGSSKRQMPRSSSTA